MYVLAKVFCGLIDICDNVECVSNDDSQYKHSQKYDKHCEP